LLALADAVAMSGLTTRVRRGALFPVACTRGLGRVWKRALAPAMPLAFAHTAGPAGTMPARSQGHIAVQFTPNQPPQQTH